MKRWHTERRVIKVGLLDGASFNPPGRTESRAIAGLLKEIVEGGVRSALHVIPNIKAGRYTIIDGHRRWTCAVAAAIEEVQCEVYTNATIADAPKLWALLNRPSRPINGLDWLVYYLETGNLDELPHVQRENVRQCEKIFGHDGLKTLVETKTAPSVYRSISRAYSLIHEYPTLSSVSRRVIGEWCVRHRMQNMVHSICSRGHGIRMARLLHKHIVHDIPVMHDALVPKVKEGQGR